MWERTWEALQQVVDEAPPADRYFSDGFSTYAQLLYSGPHAVAPGKSQTFSVEGDNAELRHYLSTAGATKPVFLAVFVGAVASSGAVCVCLEPPPDLQAGFPEDAAHVCNFVADLI